MQPAAVFRCLTAKGADLPPRSLEAGGRHQKQSPRALVQGRCGRPTQLEGRCDTELLARPPATLDARPRRRGCRHLPQARRLLPNMNFMLGAPTLLLQPGVAFLLQEIHINGLASKWTAVH